MKKYLWVVIMVVQCLIIRPLPGHAANGSQLSAVGAYQQGMGGAVTAVPYDATTAISNPAGMALIGNRTDFTFELKSPKRTTSFAKGGHSDGGSPYYLVPAVGWTAPVNDRSDLFFGGGLYGVSEMGVDYDASRAPFMAGSGLTNAQAHIYSQYQMWKLAPTIAWKKGGFAVGFALNLDHQSLGFKSYYNGVSSGGSPIKNGMDLSETQGALGYGGTIGLLYQPIPAFSVGLSYASRQVFQDFKWRLSTGDVSNGQVTNQDGIYTLQLDFPQQAALGIAIRPHRNLLWAIDVKWINYSSTYDVVQLKGQYTGGVTELPVNFGWSDVWVIATGIQYEVTPTLALRVGYNHSNSPIKAEDVDSNLAFPVIVRNHVSGGLTYRFGRHWETSLAYMQALKEHRTSNSGSGTKIGLDEKNGDFEISYRF